MYIDHAVLAMNNTDARMYIIFDLVEAPSLTFISD